MTIVHGNEKGFSVHCVTPGNLMLYFKQVYISGHMCVIAEHEKTVFKLCDDLNFALNKSFIK